MLKFFSQRPVRSLGVEEYCLSRGRWNDEIRRKRTAFWHSFSRPTGPVIDASGKANTLRVSLIQSTIEPARDNTILNLKTSNFGDFNDE